MIVAGEAATPAAGAGLAGRARTSGFVLRATVGSLAGGAVDGESPPAVAGRTPGLRTVGPSDGGATVADSSPVSGITMGASSKTEYDGRYGAV